MSASKRSDTKIPEDENVDSGFLSGPCEQYSGEVFPESEEEPKEGVLCDLSEPKTELGSGTDVNLDSGALDLNLDSGALDLNLDSGALDLGDLAEYITAVKISDTSVAPTDTFVYTVPRPGQPDTRPPLFIFFQQDDDGDTQLHIASVHGCEKSVGTLIKVCPNKALLDVANDDGHTPLHLAVMGGNAVVTRMLVRAGLSLGVRDRVGETPLHKAAAVGHVECLQALLAPVPEHPPRKLSSTLNQKNYNGQACVHLAASAGHLEALQTLLYFGADINLTENLAGWTALHIAARRGEARLAAWLRARGAAVRARDYAGRSPRRLARRSPAARAFDNLSDDSDSDSDEEDDMYDSDSESLFDRLRESMNLINVA